MRAEPGLLQLIEQTAEAAEVGVAEDLPQDAAEAAAALAWPC